MLNTIQYFSFLDFLSEVVKLLSRIFIRGSEARNTSGLSCLLVSDGANSEASSQNLWIEFTQNTSFHGIKYVFEEGIKSIRRYFI